MRGFPTIRHPLRSPVWSANGNDPVSLEGLPTRVFGRIAHLVGFVIDVFYRPTFTTAPNLVGIHNALIRNLTLFDGISERLNLSGFDIRQMEILENGALLVPDCDIPASLGDVGFRRVVSLGPRLAAGSPTDFMLPCAALKSGELRFTFGALTDHSADTTVIANANIRVTALIAALDNEIRVAPAYERRSMNFGSNDCLIQGNALFTSLGIAKQANTAFAAGDLSEITIDGGQGAANSVICSTLEAAAHWDLRSGHLNQLAGEPRAATDDNAKQVNLTTPTALVAADRFLQAVIVSPEEWRISKVLYEATSGLRVKWTGSFLTPKILFGRILEQPRTAAAAIAARAVSELKLPAPSGAKVKTLSKQTYNGPREAYMPWAFTW